MQSVVIKLKKPIQLGSETIEELTLRPPTGKEIRSLPHKTELPFVTVLSLAGKLSGQPDAVIDKLEGEDLGKVMEVASNFLASIHQIGPMSLEN